MHNRNSGAAAADPPLLLQIHHPLSRLGLTDFLTFVAVPSATKKMMLTLLWGLKDPQMVIQHVAGGGP